METKIKAQIRDVADFPKPGILFKDITPLLEDPQLTKEITNTFVERLKSHSIDAILGVESRGFLWGPLIAQALNIPFIPARKKGKLPYKTVSFKYELEYGFAEIEVHEDAIQTGSRVLIHDDLLATGGTAMAAAELIQGQGAEVAGFAFLVKLGFLKGDEALNKYSPISIGLANY